MKDITTYTKDLEKLAKSEALEFRYSINTINNLVVINRKGVNGRLNDISMPFIQPCQEAVINILQVCSHRYGGRDWTIEPCPVRFG